MAKVWFQNGPNFIAMDCVFDQFAILIVCHSCAFDEFVIVQIKCQIISSHSNNSHLHCTWKLMWPISTIVQLYVAWHRDLGNWFFHLEHTHLIFWITGLPVWAGTRKVKPIWILLKRETVSGSGISWAICKSATPRSRQIATPAPHRSVVYRPDALPATQPTASHIVGHVISPPLIVSIVWLSILELWVMMSCIACFVRKMATVTHTHTHV